MIHSVRFTCVLDTNVIYPIEIRDLLFWFASFDLFTPKWSNHIFREWEDVMRTRMFADDQCIKHKITIPILLAESIFFFYFALMQSKVYLMTAGREAKITTTRNIR